MGISNENNNFKDAWQEYKTHTERNKLVQKLASP